MGNQGRLAACILIPLLTTVGGGVFCTRFGWVMNSSAYMNVLGGSLWVVALVGLSCSGNVVPPSNDFGDVSYAQFLCAVHILAWLWCCFGIAVEIAGRNLPHGVVMVFESAITLFAFAAACDTSSHFDGPLDFCKISNNRPPCSTYHTGIALIWYLFFLMACKLCVTYKTVSRHRATAAINYRPNLDHPVGGPNTYAEAPSMASAWQRHTDQQTGMEYYFNVMTGESSWTKPDGL